MGLLRLGLSCARASGASIEAALKHPDQKCCDAKHASKTNVLVTWTASLKSFEECVAHL
jgi:hypothetical protein